MMKKPYNKQLLKPCPFCGSIPKIETEWTRVESQYEPIMLVQTRVKIECDNCFLKKDIVATSIADLNLDEKMYKYVSKMDARKVINTMWNARKA